MQLKHLPPEFIERLTVLVAPRQRDAVVAGLLTRRPTTFRRNGLKCTADQLRQAMAAQGITADPVPWYPDAFTLSSPDFRSFQETACYRDGWIYVQSLSSMLPPLILDPQPGEKILDLCAAPGSKTTQIAALMENRGVLIANDNSPIRSLKLTHNLGMQGAAIAQTRVGPGETVWMQMPEFFDRVLVDVPCSMEGTFADDDPKSYRDWTPSKPKALGKRQQWLLRSAVSCCMVGGTVVYSTCTMAPEENEYVIDWILKKERANIELADITFSCPDLVPALAAYRAKTFSHTMTKARRVLPSRTMEGFFVARLTKTGHSVPGTHRETD